MCVHPTQEPDIQPTPGTAAAQKALDVGDLLQVRGRGRITPLSLPPPLFIHLRFSFSLLPVLGMAFRGGFQEAFFMYMG